MGFCHCGCGKETRIFRGKARRFIYHHLRHSETTKQLLSKIKKESGFIPPSRLGWHQSEESKRKIGLSMKGQKRSLETGLKISRALKGKKRKPLSNERKEEIRQAMIGRFVSEETRRKRAKSLSGDKNPQWRGGITPEHWRIRESLEYKLWRHAVFERDNYTCQICGKPSNGDIEADHIKRFALYPELRFDVNNGRTLCRACHRLTETYGTKGLTKENYILCHY